MPNWYDMFRVNGPEPELEKVQARMTEVLPDISIRTRTSGGLEGRITTPDDPRRLLEVFAPEFPKLEFGLSYAEPEAECFGLLRWADGEFVDDTEAEDEDAFYVLLAKVWGPLDEDEVSGEVTRRLYEHLEFDEPLPYLRDLVDAPEPPSQASTPSGPPAPSSS